MQAWHTSAFLLQTKCICACHWHASMDCPDSPWQLSCVCDNHGTTEKNNCFTHTKDNTFYSKKIKAAKSFQKRYEHKIYLLPSSCAKWTHEVLFTSPGTTNSYISLQMLMTITATARSLKLVHPLYAASQR